jgi:hypothetical protein
MAVTPFCYYCGSFAYLVHLFNDEKREGNWGKERKGKKNEGLYDRNINPSFVVIFFSAFTHILGCTKVPLRFKSPGNDTSIKHAIQSNGRHATQCLNKIPK